MNTSPQSRYLAPTGMDRVFNSTVAALTRAGISVMGSRVLAVRGRKSGEWRTTPVNLLTVQDTRYLVAPRGQAQWVRNLRAAGQGGGKGRPDVWIPDSSSWFRHSAVGSVAMPAHAASVARSPIVIALAPATAVRLGWGSGRADLGPLLNGDSAKRPADLYLPDPNSSAVAAGALLSLQATAQRKPGGMAALTAAFRVFAEAAGEAPDEAWKLGWTA